MGERRFKLLIVDDDELLLSALTGYLEENGFIVDTASTGEEASRKFGLDPHGYGLVILDYRLQATDGATIAQELRKSNPDVFILIFSGDDSRDALKATWKAGAVEFLEKGSNLEVLLDSIKGWCRKYAETNMPASHAATRSLEQAALGPLKMVGRSKALLEVARLVEIHRGTNRNVLVLGESGTGKELVARALHNGKGEFIAVNCASYRSNPTLLESALFGHTKGSFTGADRDKKGAFEEAGGGTVFLDEIHHLNPDVQVSLLRAVQERKITRIGSSREFPVAFKLVAAAKPELALEVERREFRLDLYYRIKGATISIPPLRERREDIEPLVVHFSERWSDENGRKKVFLARAVRYLERYQWPGNVRELENEIGELLDLSEKDKIGPEDLDAKFFASHEKEPSEEVALPLRQRILCVERNHISSVLSRSRSMREAARKMKISPQSLLRLVRKHGISGDPHPSLRGVSNIVASKAELPKQSR